MGARSTAATGRPATWAATTAITRWLDDPATDSSISFYDREQDSWTDLTYAELAQRVAAASWRLADRFDVGDRVVLVGETGPDIVVAWFACVSAGISPLIVAPPGFESPADLEARMQRAAMVTGAKGLLVSAPALPAITATQIDVALLPMEEFADGSAVEHTRCTRASALAFVQLTSGTSGAPKAVGVTIDGLEENLRAVRRWLQIGPDDQGSSWLPLYHDLGLVGSLLNATAAQMSAHYMAPESFMTRPMRWIETVAVRGASISASPTFGLSYCERNLPDPMPADWDFEGWRVLCLGGERVDVEAVVRFARRLQPRGFDPAAVAPAYGMAEATVCVSGAVVSDPPRLLRLPPGPITPEAISAAEATVLEVTTLDGIDLDATWLMGNGPPLDGIDIQVRALQDGQDDGLGELVVATPSPGVAVTPDGLGPLDAHVDGVLLTGDSGFIHGSEVFVLGRIGEACKVRGRLIHAEDVEADLARGLTRHFRGCVAMGALADASQEVVVVSERPLSEDEAAAARSIASRRTGGHIPVRVAILSDGERVPRTSSGKPRRGTLWARHLQHGLPVGAVEA